MSPNPREVEEKLDPRVKRTRSLILQAFMELLPEKGFQSVSVQDITEKAGINRATFYAHFPDKYALLDHSIQQGFRAEIEKRMLDACHYSDENLKTLIITVSEFVSTANSHCKPSNPQFESLVEAQVKNQLQGLLQVWLEQDDAQIDAKTAATAASWAIYGLVLQWNHDKNKKKPPADKFADQVLPLIASNLRLAQPA
ncbi:MAG: TetR/AcrR family transcriptional regulator [Chloroflexota bacterium]